MIWHDLQELIAMGGYGLYVWGSFGVTLLLMAGEAWSVSRRLRQVQAEVRQHGGEA